MKPEAPVTASASDTHPAVRTRLRYARLPVLAMSMVALLMALWAGLLRLGFDLPVIKARFYLPHGPLMVCGFLGTLISLERAVALGEWWEYAAPALSGTGAIALMLGASDPIGAGLITLGSAGLIGIFALIVHRQTALFTITMTLGAVAWFVGNCLWLAGVPMMDMFFWWTGFLVLTIAGERLELSRLTGPGERNRALFVFGAGAMLAGLTIGLRFPSPGMRIAGLGMLAIAFWLLRYDLARRTVRQRGLTRFMAINLLAGYFWLGAGGIAWMWFGGDLTTFHYDVMLHTIFLGFVFSMIFAHAPVIFPAIVQRPLPYNGRFYAHSALLHASLMLRIGGDLAPSYSAFELGGLLNVAALLLFVGNTGQAVLSGILRSCQPASALPAARRGAP